MSMPWSSANDGQRVLRLGGADEADRAADDRGRPRARRRAASPAGGTARSGRCRSRRPRRRGAAPTARRAAAERVVPHSRASAGHPLVAQEAEHLVVARAAGRAVTPDGDHVRVGEDRRAGLQRGPRGARRGAGGRRGRATRSTWPVPWTIRTATFSASAGTPVERRPRGGSSRTSRRRSPRRRRRSRSAAAAARAASLVLARRPARATLRHGVTPARAVRGPAARDERRGSRTPVGTPATCGRRPATAPYGERRRCDLRSAGSRGRAGGGQRRRAARRRARARRRRRRGRRGSARARSTSAAGSLVERDDRAPAGEPTRSWRVRRRRAATSPRSRLRSTRSPRPSSSTNRNRPGRPASAGSAHSSRVELVGDRAQVGPAAGEPGLRRDHHVADQLVGRATGSSPVASIALDDLGRAGRRRRAAGRAAGGWPGRSGARRRRRTSAATSASAAQRRGREPAADQPQPDERAVVGRPRAEDAGAAVPAGTRRADVTLTGTLEVGGSCAGPVIDLAAVAARASRSSDSGSPGAGHLPGSAATQWLTGLAGRCPARHPHRCASVPDSHRVP